jgi:hypothetical protein
MRTALAAVLLTVCAMPVSAQDVRLAPGLVWQAGIFGDDGPESTAGLRPTGSLLVRGQTARRVGLTFEATIEPLGIDNPHFDERLHTMHLLFGPEIGGRFTVRPAVGLGVQFWTGSSAEYPVGAALAAGIAIGHRHPPGQGPAGTEWRRVHISPELIARFSGSPGALTWMAGMQVPITWRR